MMSPKKFETEKSHITREILAYLAEHPDAQDSLEGVVEWWLLEQKIKHKTAEVRASLSELVKKGILVEYEGKNAHIYYRINRSKYEEIKAMSKN